MDGSIAETSVFCLICSWEESPSQSGKTALGQGLLGAGLGTMHFSRQRCSSEKQILASVTGTQDGVGASTHGLLAKLRSGPELFLFEDE